MPKQMIRVQRNVDMVVMLFRYPGNVSLATVRNGNLSGEWRHRVYATTWDSVPSLFTRLVQDERNPLCKQK